MSKLSGGSCGGISLLEILVVVVVIITMAGLARSPMSRYYRTLEQKHAVAGIRKLIQTARSRAMSNPSVHCGVSFDLGSVPPRAFLFEDSYAPGAYAYDPEKDKPYLAPLVLPKKTVLSIPAEYPPALIYRGDGSAYLSAMVIVESPGFKDTVDVLASTGRVRSTR